MPFISLDKLQIIESNDYQTLLTTITVDLNTPVTDIAAMASEAYKQFLARDIVKECVVFKINLQSYEPVDEESFITLTNIFTTAFFSQIVTNKGRNREHRLNIPANLNEIHVSLSLLKKAINAQTIIDNFNLIITCNEFYYMLVDGGMQNE